MNLDIVKEQLYQEVNRQDQQIDLAKSTLCIAQFAYPNLSVDKYLDILDEMAKTIQERLPEQKYPLKIIKSINKYLFEELQYRGNKEDYYNPDNSFLNQVIEKRKGIPISLSILYLEIAKRINFPMVGVGMPGHFLIRPEFIDGEIFVDVFNQGEVLFKEDCQKTFQEIYKDSFQLEKHFLESVSNRQILARMLTNLKFIYLNKQEFSKALGIIELVLTIYPKHPLELRDKGLIYYQLGEWEKARTNLEAYLALSPKTEDQEEILKIIEKMR